MNNISKAVILLFFLVACGRKEESGNGSPRQWMEEPERPPHPIVAYDSVNEKGVLIGDGIELMDTAFNVIQDISNYNELIVNITGVSRAYYHHYNDYNSDTLEPCEKFKYIRIKTRDFEGIVEGQFVYRPIESPQNKVIKTKDNRLEFIATSNYGAKQSGKDEGTPCLVLTPLLFRDKKSNYEGLITLMNGKAYDIYFPYMEINANEEGAEETDKLKIVGDDYELIINSKFEIDDTRKGDGPPRPDSLKVRRESNGKFTAKILE